MDQVDIIELIEGFINEKGIVTEHPFCAETEIKGIIKSYNELEEELALQQAEVSRLKNDLKCSDKFLVGWHNKFVKEQLKTMELEEKLEILQGAYDATRIHMDLLLSKNKHLEKLLKIENNIKAVIKEMKKGNGS